MPGADEGGNDDMMSPGSGVELRSRPTRSVKHGKRPSGAYMSIDETDDAEAYAESITEAERDLLVEPRFSVDSDDSDDYGDRPLPQKRVEVKRTGVRYYLPSWKYAVFGVLLIVVVVVALWGDIRLLPEPPPDSYVSYSTISLSVALWDRSVERNVIAQCSRF